MARNDNRDAKRREKVRQKRQYEQDHIRFLPSIVVNPGTSSRHFVNAVAAAVKVVQKDVRKLLSNSEIEAVNAYFLRQYQLGQRATMRLDDAVTKFAEAVYGIVLKSYPIPIGTFLLEPSLEKSGVINLNCTSFKESKSSYGTRYYADHDLIYSKDGRVGEKTDKILGYTRHFLERALERNLSGPQLRRHQHLYQCLTNTVILVKNKWLYRVYVRTKGLIRDTLTQFAGKTILGDIYCCIGYIPESHDGNFIVAKTILLPGMRGTPEEHIRGLGKVNNLFDDDYLETLQERSGIAMFMDVIKLGDGYSLNEIMWHNCDMPGERIPATVRLKITSRIRANVQVLRMAEDSREDHGSDERSGRPTGPCHGVPGGCGTQAVINA